MKKDIDVKIGSKIHKESRERDNRSNSSDSGQSRRRERKEGKREIVIKPRTNWSKEQLNIEEMDPEELKKYQSDYIAPDNRLSQTYKLQDKQKKLFKEMVTENVELEKPEQLAEDQSQSQPLPIVKRESSTHYYRGFVPGAKNVILDNTRIKRKIPIPTNKNFNYAGIIIGPRGSNQKRLEEETGCKILVRGRGSQKEGQPMQPDDWDKMHVLIAGDTEEQVNSAAKEIEKILLLNEQTRNMIRQEQLKEVAKIRFSEQGKAGHIPNEIRLGTLAVANSNAFILPIPNEAVGLVIGMGGETMREIQSRSEAINIWMDPDAPPGGATRNLFVDGSEDSFIRVKKIIDEIISTQTKMRVALSDNSQEIALNVQISIPVTALPFVVGKNAEVLGQISELTGAKLSFVPPKNYESVHRIIACVGVSSQIIKTKHEIDKILAQNNFAEVSTLNYTNKMLKTDNEEKEAIDRKGLFEGEIQNSAGGLSITDRGTNYYAQLRDYFGLGLDFLGDYKSQNEIRITDYYPDGTIDVSYYS